MSDLTYGNGHYARVAGVWRYASTGEPVPGAQDLPIGPRIVMSAPELHPDALLDTAAAASYWGCTRGSWRQFVVRGSAPQPVVHIGGSPCWTREVIDHWRAAHPVKRGRPAR